MEKGDRPTTLFLDIGGVLLTNGWDRSSRRKAAEKFEIDFAEMDERHHLTYDTFESGKLSLDEYLDRVVFFRKIDCDRNDFKNFMFEQSQAYHDMIELVKEVKQKYRLKVGVISNEGLELTEYRISKFSLGEFVDFFVSSCFVHLRKPDKDIYKMALAMAHASPEESLYVDDRLMFVEIARSLGIRSVNHVDYQDTKAALESFGFYAGL